MLWFYLLKKLRLCIDMVFFRSPAYIGSALDDQAYWLVYRLLLARRRFWFNPVLVFRLSRVIRCARLRLRRRVQKMAFL